MKALIDGDILLYSVGHAIDDRYYTVQNERFKYKKEAVQYCEDCMITVDQIQHHRDAAPEAFYYHGLNIKIQSILQATDCTDYTVYLTGDNNFRKDLAVSHVYKGNRPEDGKPLLYHQMKEYLLMNFNCEVCDGYEADDGMAMAQTKHSVICSEDKDLDQVEGFHYSWANNELSYVPKSYGICWFWTQMLTGDPTDNIHGIHGIGYKKAEKLLQDCKTQKEMRCVVGLQYAIHFDNPEDRMWENAGLLWMCRTLDDIKAPGEVLGDMYANND